MRTMLTAAPRDTRWSLIFLVVAVSALAALVTAPQAHATSGYLSTWSGLYPGSASDDNAGCQLCHGTSTQNINPYGFAMALCNGATGTISQRIQAIEGADSDGQGDSNLVETNADTQPGWTTSPVEVWSRNGCVSQGTNTYPGAGDVDPAPVNVPPTADANGPYSGTAGTPVSFDGTGSSDPDGTIVAYDWDFGDGNTGTGATPTNTYAAAGTYTVTLTVTDDAGATDTATSTASIGAGNAPPIADANGPYSGTVGIAVTFDGTGSTDPDGTIVAYDWDFGDGNTGTGATPTNTYAAAGPYTVTLTVTDDAGATDTATSTATIVDAPQDPIADPNGPYTGTTNVALILDGSGSFDPDGGTITQYDWDFGDGNTGTGESPTHTYTAAGTYTVTLSVVDDEGATSAPVTTSATISDPPANIPPTSDPNGPYTGTAGSPVSFDGSGSSDSDGTIVSYDWDFGDGGTGTGVSPTHTYAAAGNYTVSLTVTDDGTPAESDTVTTSAAISEVPACSGIDDLVAEWRTQGNGQLRVSGTGVRDGTIILSNAFDPNQIIDTRNGKNGRVNFNVNGKNLNPVPCVVQVDQPDVQLCGQAVVIGAPADCAPPPPVGFLPTARGDTYATPVGNPITVTASRVSGVLYNDFGGVPPLTASLVAGPTAGTLDAFGADGSFTYTPGAGMIDNSLDQFTYVAVDADGVTSAEATVVLQTLSNQPDFKIMMNYELGMHCTGFEFAYCCVLPPYNSILAQVVKPAQGDPTSTEDNFVDGFPRLLEGDPNVGRDGLNRETVVRDWDADTNQFQKYQLRYYHDAQPRQEGNTGKPNTSTLISDVEGNSLQYFNTIFDSAAPDPVTNALIYDDYNGYSNVIQGSGVIGDVPTDNYANAWLNHFYIYIDPETGAPNLEGHGNTGLEADKIRLGVAGQVAYPPNSGAALQPMGPTGNGAFDNVLTFSADTGTVVYTQMKVLEDLPIMLTSPRIWEALGLPLTPFEDTIDFFGDPGAVDEDAVRPFVAMKASLHEYPSGDAVIGSNQQPVIGFGTAPIDIPNCERCHSAPSISPDTGLPNVNSPNFNRPDAFYPHSTGTVPFGTGLEDMTDLEYNFWVAYYDIVPGVDSDWYARLKGAAINMLTLHDFDVGTSFTANYAGVDCTNNPDPADPTIDPGSYACSFEPLNPDGSPNLADLTNQTDIPQNTRLGHESVICQRCHADNVIANVKSATLDAAGAFPIKPITEAIHNRHRNAGDPANGGEGGVIVFNDSLGRDGGCQGCHPAHRSDGVMDDYPITLDGDNANADNDNRLNLGGCFVGRDVHSNPLKDIDGAETPEHLNALGEYLMANVSHDNGDKRGIWCTNCHSQVGQEMWKAENCVDLINNNCAPGENPRAAADMPALAAALNTSLAQLESWADPKVPGVNGSDDLPLSGPGTRTGDFTHAIWDPDPGLCNYVAGAFGVIPVDPAHDGNVATVEVNVTSAAACSTGGGSALIDCGAEYPGAPAFHICGSFDPDGDFNVSLASVAAGIADQVSPFCTTQDCVDAITTAGLPAGSVAVPVPFSAATDGRDHWLASGEPHCADCHKAPYVEQSGNITAYPPFNYPNKASLMRYTRGHQDISCQGCHESIHGLYPVTPTVDTTSYAQAAALNNDGSHGPLKCAACHTHVNADEVPTWVENLTYTDPVDGGPAVSVVNNFDAAVGWMHTYTAEADPAADVCQNCHGPEVPDVGDGEYLEHAMTNRTSRVAMDAAERAVNNGQVFGQAPGAQRDQLCSNCHDGENELGNQSCGEEWREHLIQGRVSQVVWEELSAPLGGCGW